MLIHSPRELDVPMTSSQREVLDVYLGGGKEVEVVAMGGTRRGGKTFTGAHCIGYRRLKYANTKGLAIRTIQRASDLNMGEELRVAFFEPHGFPIGLRRRGEIQYLENERRFLFPNGSMIQLGYCRRPNDWEQHLGLQWDDIWFEQAEQFPEKVYNRLSGSSYANNPACLPRRLLTFNPGGIGQEWLERRVVNPKTRDRRLVWVESDIRKCPATLERDPSYILRSLMTITDPVLRAQWLDGDWDAQSGLFFRLVPSLEGVPGTIREVAVPYWADWYGGVDWGEDKPFAYVIVAHWQDQDDRGNWKRHLHVGGEVYQAGLDLDQQAERSLEREKELKRTFPFMHNIDIRMADPSTAAPLEKESSEQTRTKASVWRAHGFGTYPSFRYSRTSGWSLIKYLLRHHILTIDPECMALIGEFKGAIRQEWGEDIDDRRCAEHALDALRYIVCYLFGLDYAEELDEERRWALGIKVP